MKLGSTYEYSHTVTPLMLRLFGIRETEQKDILELVSSPLQETNEHKKPSSLLRT